MTATATTDTPAARKGRKVEQVLEGARAVFLRDGFEGASVDEIAREAAVSKATLYSYFPDKRALFVEVATQECCRQADEAMELVGLNMPPEVVLPEAARRMIEFFLSEFGRAVFRICVAEAERFPELGRQFYESGPLLVRDRIAAYLACAIERGELEIEDTLLAADQFAELCKASIFAPVLFGIKGAFSASDRARVAKGAVDMFLARYRTHR